MDNALSLAPVEEEEPRELLEELVECEARVLEGVPSRVLVSREREREPKEVRVEPAPVVARGVRSESSEYCMRG